MQIRKPYKEKEECLLSFMENEETVNRMLKEFGLDPEEGHIINGHVPVHQLEGEKPCKMWRKGDRDRSTAAFVRHTGM